MFLLLRNLQRFLGAPCQALGMKTMYLFLITISQYFTFLISVLQMNPGECPTQRVCVCKTEITGFKRLVQSIGDSEESTTTSKKQICPKSCDRGPEDRDPGLFMWDLCSRVSLCIWIVDGLKHLLKD